MNGKLFAAIAVLVGVLALLLPTDAKAMAYSKGKELGLISLTKVDGVLVEKRTAAAFIGLRQAAIRDGITLKLNSGFRSMEEQQRLYTKYLTQGGATAAKPGYSNHQRGTALDIATGGSFETPTYKWLAANAPSFGFNNNEGRAVREPWHWVYEGSV